MKIVINPSYSTLTQFIESISTLFEQTGVTIYKGRNEVKIFEVNGLTINVKRFKIPLLINRIVYTFFSKTKAEKAYNNASEVIKRGFETPEPIAFLEEYSGGLLRYSYFFSIHAASQKEIRTFYWGPLAGNEAILTALAQYTAQLHEKEIYHLDYSPGNILFEEREGRYHFSLVDINRMEFKSVDLLLGCENFKRLFGNEDLYVHLAKAYAKARNLEEQECIRLVLNYRNKQIQAKKRKQRLVALFKKRPH